MLVLAALTFVLWARVDAGRAVDHAVALLIVTCPCALGLATPLALSAAIGRAARAGFNPVVAAVLMPLSSITVIASSYRARSFTRAEGPTCR